MNASLARCKGLPLLLGIPVYVSSAGDIPSPTTVRFGVPPASLRDLEEFSGEPRPTLTPGHALVREKPQNGPEQQPPSVSFNFQGVLDQRLTRNLTNLLTAPQFLNYFVDDQKRHLPSESALNTDVWNLTKSSFRQSVRSYFAGSVITNMPLATVVKESLIDLFDYPERHNLVNPFDPREGIPGEDGIRSAGPDKFKVGARIFTSSPYLYGTYKDDFHIRLYYDDLLKRREPAFEMTFQQHLSPTWVMSMGVIGRLMDQQDPTTQERDELAGYFGLTGSYRGGLATLGVFPGQHSTRLAATYSRAW